MRAGEDFAAGEVAGPARIDPGPPPDATGQVGVRRHHAQLVVLAEIGDDPRLLGVDLAPGRGGVVAVEQLRAEDEVLVVGERHAGVLRVRGRREEGAAPAQRALGRALGEPLGARPIGPLGEHLPLWVDAAQVLRVLRRPDAQDRVEVLDLVQPQGREVVQLLVAPLAQPDLLQPVERDLDVGERPQPQRLTVDLAH